MSGVGAKWAVLGGLAVTASLGIAAAQFNGSSPTTNGQLQQMDRAHGTDEPPFPAREMQERQLKRLREEHQKEIFSDTDRLVQLATALKTEVEKRDKAAAPNVVKDVDEIGKLAKRVSERIKMQ
ncbi:MAG: hypothetical protein QOH35_3644 [Acidobacteriaceae bacterium]|nr:hypothetical protein [Acidobacteriaceae bacterium]MEA3007938.1 hypothetical protein [Acidobacteriaceae bacterium]